MRLTTLLRINTPNKGRTPQPINKVPFREMMPLRLKERVSGKSDTKKEGSCLHEITMLIKCLETNDYENKMCVKQAESLNICFENFQKAKKGAKVTKEKGNLVPGEKSLTHKQVHKLFRMQPLS